MERLSVDSLIPKFSDMALWELSVKLQGPLMEEMKSLYGPKFPIEVRHYLANWIESQRWSEIEPENPHHDREARLLYEGMLQALLDLITTYATNFITKTQLEALLQHMKMQYDNQPLELARVVQMCLCREADLCGRQKQLSLSAPSPMVRVPPSNEIDLILKTIINHTSTMDQEFRTLSSKLENFMLKHQEKYQIESAFNRIQPDQVARYRDRVKVLERMITCDTEAMNKTYEELAQRFNACLDQVRLAQNLLVEHELASWKQQQQLCRLDEDGGGKGELANMQQRFESLAELISKNRLLAKQLELLKTRIPQGILIGDVYPALFQLFTQQLSDLVQASFLIEKQPPQVIKTANRFSAVVRLLVGGKLQIHLGAPEVTVTIINDKQAKSVVNDTQKLIPPNFSSGDIMNNQKAMEFNSQTNVYSCAFNFMQLRKIKRNTDRRASEMVTEEKFAFLFRTHFTIGSGELEISVKTISLPVVVIVHVTQAPPAEATIFWDNGFSEPNREPFVVPDTVQWPLVSDALNRFCHASSGRGLTPQNLDYLGRKLLGIGPEDELTKITRTQLCKDQLKGKGFTFWEWFYKHLELIKTTLKREWMEGSIQGFMQRADAERMLLQCSPGTFLIRFSEGEPGGISVAWVTEDMNSERQVLSLAPWNKHDLVIRALADRLHDLGHLQVLYPSKPKDEVFGKYYTPAQTQSMDGSGYIHNELITALQAMPGTARALSMPASPAPSIVSIGTPISPPWPMSNGGGLNIPDLDWANLASLPEDSIMLDATPTGGQAQ